MIRTCALFCLWELLSLDPQPTNQTISVCSMEKWYFRITSNSKVEEKGYVYLVSVEVPAGTEEKRYTCMMKMA